MAELGVASALHILESVSRTPEVDLRGVLTAAFRSAIGGPFQVGTGIVVDDHGTASDRIPIVIYKTSVTQETPAPISANSVSTVIDVVGRLTESLLVASYGRIASAKSLSKLPEEDAPEDGSHATFGVLCAQSSAISIEEICQILERLNANHASTSWLDMIAIDGVGLVEYSVQFPGEDHLGGSWTIPPEGLLTVAPGVYVAMSKSPAPDSALTRMLGRILQALLLFFRPSELPPHAEINALRENPPDQIVAIAYQYDLSGELRPAPEWAYRDRIAPEPPLLLLSQGNKEALASIRYLPWQDGGVIVMQGKFPLQGFLLMSDLPRERQIILNRPDNLQISYVLPLNRASFLRLLSDFRMRSNLMIRPSEARPIIQKIADEGTSSPYVARLMLGILHLRDIAIDRSNNPALLESFDRSYESLTQSLSAARTSAALVLDLWNGHQNRILTGQIVRNEFSRIHIMEGIDRELRRELENFLNASTRLLKLNLQHISGLLGTNIGFLFGKTDAFLRGCDEMTKKDIALSNYIKEVRSWSEGLILSRNAIEHEGWILPRVSYEEAQGHIVAGEPEVRGVPLTTFVDHILDRCCCAVEDVVAHLLQGRMPEVFTIADTSPESRPASCPLRFKLTFSRGGLSRWSIAYTSTRFLDR